MCSLNVVIRTLKGNHAIFPVAITNLVLKVERVGLEANSLSEKCMVEEALDKQLGDLVGAGL
jgi:hypothetical protein